MSRMLDKATEQFRAGQYKKAADTLWEVTFAGEDGESEAQAVLALATQLRDATDGGVRAACEEHVARAERFLQPATTAANVTAPGELLLDEEPATLARRAREAGLTWLEIVRSTDLVAAATHDRLACGRPDVVSQPAFIDAVEAEGWRLEHFACLFKPTKVQTTIFRGADILGGDPVQGEERYLYLFRRGNEASGH